MMSLELFSRFSSNFGTYNIGTSLDLIRFGDLDHIFKFSTGQIMSDFGQIYMVELSGFFLKNCFSFLVPNKNLGTLKRIFLFFTMKLG